jgi:uncharacterized membrane protein YbaN (DUF454 family)
MVEGFNPSLTAPAERAAPCTISTWSGWARSKATCCATPSRSWRGWRLAELGLSEYLDCEHRTVGMRDLTRTLLIITGTLCVMLGVLGLFLPVLPTTPFLLLAAACYARSSRRFYHWLTTNRWFGEYIRNYREGRGIPPQQKILTLLLLWLTIGYAAWFAVSLWWVKLIRLGIAAGVTIHLARTKTFRPE